MIEDIEILQNDLTNLECWVREWLMTFNMDKCEIIQISLKPLTPNSYTLFGQHLEMVTKAHYLGVTIDYRLSFVSILILYVKGNSTVATVC